MPGTVKVHINVRVISEMIGLAKLTFLKESYVPAKLLYFCRSIANSGLK